MLVKQFKNPAQACNKNRAASVRRRPSMPLRPTIKTPCRDQPTIYNKLKNLVLCDKRRIAKAVRPDRVKKPTNPAGVHLNHFITCIYAHGGRYLHEMSIFWSARRLAQPAFALQQAPEGVKSVRHNSRKEPSCDGSQPLL
jgi:hypothetical protein